MIQIDMTMPKNCIECPIHDGEYGWCDLDADIAMNCDDRPDNCPLHEATADFDTVSMQSETTTEIQKILDYLDNELHPLVSPNNWNVYSELYDMVSELENLPPSPTPTDTPEPQIPFKTLQNACKYRRIYHIEGYFEKRHVCYNKKNAAECNSDCPLLNRKGDGGAV